MTYSDKVKQSKKVLEAIKALGNDETIVVSYGKDYNGQPKEYRIRCTIYEHSGVTYSIHTNDYWSVSGMNIDSLTNTQAKTYTYDMMRQRTSYNFPLYEMELVPEEVNPLENLPGYIGTEKGELV
jgi:hypothetical protein